jgi:hypothetical protein
VEADGVCKLGILFPSGALIALALAMSGPSSAQSAMPQAAAPDVDVRDSEFLDYLDEHWSCGKDARLTQAQTHEILTHEDTFTLYSHWSRDPIVVAEVGGQAGGTMMFRHVGGRWLATFLAEGSSIEGIRSTRDHSRTFIVSLWVREDPGNLAVSSYDWRTGAISCADLDVPGVNTGLEFPSFKRLELDAHGHGQLLAIVDIEREGQELHWKRIYAYLTRNYGRRWGPPRHLAQLPPARNVLTSITRRGIDASLRTRIEADSRQ